MTLVRVTVVHPFRNSSKVLYLPKSNLSRDVKMGLPTSLMPTYVYMLIEKSHQNMLRKTNGLWVGFWSDPGPLVGSGRVFWSGPGLLIASGRVFWSGPGPLVDSGSFGRINVFWTASGLPVGSGSFGPILIFWSDPGLLVQSGSFSRIRVLTIGSVSGFFLNGRIQIWMFPSGLYYQDSVARHHRDVLLSSF